MAYLSTHGVCLQLRRWVGSDDVIMTVTTVVVSLLPFGRLYSYVRGYMFRSLFKVAYIGRFVFKLW